MRILFINFNIGSTPGINNGLAILSAVLKERKHEVKLLFISDELDYGFDLKRIKQDILEFEPKLIGVSLMEPQFKYMLKFCGKIREYYKEFIICGGPFPTMDPETVLSVNAVNAVCVGEGEYALCELVDALQNNQNINDIRNLWVKTSDGAVVRNRLRPFVDIDKLPPDDKELFDLEKILPLKSFQLETMLGRGCIYKCSYCINDAYLFQYKKLGENSVTLKEYVRVKNIDTAINELKNSIANHAQIRKIAFIDDNFLFYGNFMSDFCEKYKKEIRLPFMCNANPLSFDLNKAKILKDAGCVDIRFGIESGSERVKREILRRPITNQRVINAFDINRKLGMLTSTFNMIGLPTETKEEMLETLKLNAFISPDTVKVMTFYPFKNTPIYSLCEKLNLINYKKKFNLDNYDTFTCLKFSVKHQLYLKKVQAVFNWYLNLFFNREAALRYSSLIKQVEGMTEKEWEEFDYCAVDKEISDKLRRKGVPHYSKFINRSLSIKYPSGHFH